MQKLTCKFSNHICVHLTIIYMFVSVPIHYNSCKNNYSLIPEKNIWKEGIVIHTFKLGKRFLSSFLNHWIIKTISVSKDYSEYACQNHQKIVTSAS